VTVFSQRRSSIALTIVLLAGTAAASCRARAGGVEASPVAGAGVQTARIVVGERGYEPPTVSLRAGVPARITFVRTSDKTCGTDVLFQSLDIKRPLPLNQPVDIEFTPAKAGEIVFECGMYMLRGTVVVREQGP
jgi:plastocyanin domain-containing protein